MHSCSRAFPLFGVFLILVAALSVFAPPADAGRASPSKTNPRHMERSPEQHRWRLKPISLPKSTIYENPPKRGLLFEDDRTLGDLSSVDKGATKACRIGNFRRYGGGFVRAGGEVYRAARSRDILRPSGIRLRAGVYIFKREGSTRCTVYIAGNR